MGVFCVLGGWTFGGFGLLVVGFCLLGGLVLVGRFWILVDGFWF